MKDVATCDKPLVSGSKIIRGSPNGATPPVNAGEPVAENIGYRRLTRGSETSQYPEEKKAIRDSVSSGERKRMSLNRWHVIGQFRYVSGVVGLSRSVTGHSKRLQNCLLVEHDWISRTIEGDSTVHEKSTVLWIISQVTRVKWKPV